MEKKMIDEEARRLVLKKKVNGAKFMLKCASGFLLKSGVFGACGSCRDSFLCYKIRRLVETDITKAYDSVERGGGNEVPKV